jgi:hypothetical protein
MVVVLFEMKVRGKRNQRENFGFRERKARLGFFCWRKVEKR